MRVKLAVAALVVVAVAVGLLVGGPHDTAGEPVAQAALAEEDPRPNVILFLTDDQRLTDMRALPMVRSRIGDEGATFVRAFSQYPLCCPARATLLTGQYAHNHGVMGNTPPYGGFVRFADDETLPVWLQRAGYNTIMLGKYLNGYDLPATRTYVPPGWTDWQAKAMDVYNYRSFVMNENGTLVRHQRNPSDFVRTRGSALVRKYAALDAPFFLFAGFVAPHSGLPIEKDDPLAEGGHHALKTPGVAKEFRDAFRGTPLPRKPSLFESDMSDKPSMTMVNDRPRREFREAYQQRLESLLSVDKAVNGVLDALAETGEDEETLVIFTSDNGQLIGEHRSFDKIVGYEESVRVPLLLRGPGIPAGVERDQLVTLGDLASTITEAAGAEPVLVQDGMPLQPLAQDPEVAASRAIPLEAGPTADSDGERQYTAIRTPDGRVLIEWYTGDVEYYNLEEDPYQLDGTLSAGETEDEREALLDRLATLRDCAGASCR